MNLVNVTEYQVLGYNVSEFNGQRYYSFNLAYKCVLDDKGLGTFGSKFITVKCDDSIYAALKDRVGKTIKAVLTQKTFQGKSSNYFAGYEF